MKAQNIVKKIKAVYCGMSLVKKTALWYSASDAIRTGMVILITPFITRLMTQEEVGLFSLYTTWESILTIFITLNLSCGVYEVYLTDYQDRREQVSGSLLTLTLLISSGMYLVYLCMRDYLNALIGLDTFLMSALFVEAVAVAIVRFWQTRNRFDYKYVLCSGIAIFVGVSRAILSVLMVYFVNTNRVQARAVGQVLPQVLLALILVVVILKRTNWRGITTYWKGAVLFNIVLIPHYLSNILLASSDRIMIDKYCGGASVAIYSIAYTFGNLLLVILSSISSAISPVIMGQLKNKEFAAIKKLITMVALVMALMSIMVVLVAPEVMYVLADESYQEGVYAIPAIVSGVFLSTLYSLASNAEFYYKKNKHLTAITFSGAALNIGLNMLFIPQYGYVAASYTTLISFGCMAVIHFIIISRITEQPIFSWKAMVSAGLCVIAVGEILKLLYPYPLLRWSIIIVVAIVITYSRKKLVACGRKILSQEK